MNFSNFQILNVRTIHKQLTRLLTINEQNDLGTEDVFKPFQGKFLFLRILHNLDLIIF